MQPPKEFQDITIDCAGCSLPFTWSSREQAFYDEKGFTNPPKRCARCRQQRRDGVAATAERRAQQPANGRREYEVICASCGKETTVPFQPSQGRPVYCRTCFESQRV